MTSQVNFSQITFLAGLISLQSTSHLHPDAGDGTIIPTLRQLLALTLPVLTLPVVLILH